MIFTIIIPTKNRASMLMKAVESVQRQTFSEWELIIVDNGSTDDTEKVLAPLLSPRIRYLKNERTVGPGGSRNVGIKAANPSTQYISLLDDDDVYLPDFLRRTHEALSDTSSDIGFSWTGVEYVFPHLNKSEVFFWDPAFRSKEEAFNGFLEKRLIGTGYGITFKKEVFRNVGLFDESLRAVEDTDFFLRVLKEYFYKKIPDTLVRITRHENNHVNRDSEEKAMALSAIYRKHRDALRENPKAAYNFVAKISAIFYRIGKKEKGRAFLKEALESRFSMRLLLLWLRLEVL